MFNRLTELPSTLTRVLCHAHKTFDDLEHLSLRSWPQTWSDTSLGFGGIAGQAISTAQTILLEDEEKGIAHVYHGGRYAYTCKCDEGYREHLLGQRFPGKREPKKKLKEIKRG
jgi:hypothetical protein